MLVTEMYSWQLGKGRGDGSQMLEVGQGLSCGPAAFT